MAQFSDYLSEGVNAMSAGRGQVSGSWADVWKQGAVNYATQAMANQHEIDMWKMQNEYNTPTAQMERFAAAGLNPNLVYTQGTSGNATSAPSTHAMENPSFSQDTANKYKRWDSILNAINTTLGVADGISGMIGQAQNLKLRQNEIFQSDMQTALMGAMANDFLMQNAHPQSVTVPHGASKYVSSFQDALHGGAMPKSFNPTTALLGAFLPNGIKQSIQSQMWPYQERALDFANRHNLFISNELDPLLKQFNQGRVDSLGLNNNLTRMYNEFLDSLGPFGRAIHYKTGNLLAPFKLF